MEFPKYPKIKLLGSPENREIFMHDDDDIVVEEKMDGANTRIYIYDGRIIFGSRNVQMTSDEGEPTFIKQNFRKSYVYAINKLNWRKDLHKYNGLILFGETMVKHTLDYDWERVPPILFFDVLDTNTGKFLNYEEKMRVFKELDLPTVPVVMVEKAKKLREMQIDDKFVPKSQYRDGYAEGVVFKNYARGIFAKYVRSEFREKNKEVFGYNKKYANTDEEKVIAMYCTNARIEKAIMKLIDEQGLQLDMKMMKYLPRMVWEDIVEEEGKEILNSNFVLDLRKVRKMVAKRCLAVLKQMIVNNSLVGDVDEA